MDLASSICVFLSYILQFLKKKRSSTWEGIGKKHKVWGGGEGRSKNNANIVLAYKILKTEIEVKNVTGYSEDNRNNGSNV